MKRQLLSKEIEEILEFADQMYLGLYAPARAVLLEGIKGPLRERLASAHVDPSNIFKIKSELARIYKTVEPGKSVGIITAQSVGEMQTQMNLNIFHQAGCRDKQVEQASRLQELTCTSRSETQSSPTGFVYFKKGYSKEYMFRSLTFMTFEKYTLSYELQDLSEPLELWEKKYMEFFQEDFADYKWAQTYSLNIELLYRYRITLQEIRDLLISEVNGDLNIGLSFSPLYMGKLKVYARDLQTIRRVHKIFGPTVLHGIPGIIQAYFVPVRAGSLEMYIETEGTNLARILDLPFVETHLTLSNDIWEIYNMFGIEAVREFLVEELTSIMPSVHFSHIELLADRMTVSGKLRSMTRYTRKNENKASVLSKITFEETMKRTTDASFKEQSDNMLGCSSSIICGKLPSVGTGLNELLFTL